jgi:cAMP-binding proteins - catabolite gene activator and regulatory subunit of cAMP-dependent protein kinases
MVQERRFVSDLSLLAAAHCGYCDHRSIALQQMNVQTLRHVPLFESLDTETAHELCQLLDSLDCKAGAVLFRTGDEGDAMYIIERGRSVSACERRMVTRYAYRIAPRRFLWGNGLARR